MEAVGDIRKRSSKFSLIISIYLFSVTGSLFQPIIDLLLYFISH